MTDINCQWPVAAAAHKSNAIDAIEDFTVFFLH